MRERVLNAIYKKLEENPNDLNLQKQTVLLNKSHICTIHSFCLEIIKNNFYEIDISPNFRIGDIQEIELLKLEAMEDLFEELYQKQDKDFLEATRMYTTYRGDEPLKELLLEIYRYIQSNPFPEDWIEEKVEYFNIENTEQDFSKTKWGTVLLQEIRDITESSLIKLEILKNKLKKEELLKYEEVIKEDIKGLEVIKQNLTFWDSGYKAINEMEWQRWPTDKKNNSELKENVKEARKQIKEEYTKKVNKIMLYTSKEANEDIKSMYPILNTLKKLVLAFNNKYQVKKKEKNIIDFNDIEHYALKILIQKDNNGNYVQTEVAKKYQKEFIEIAVDEYQDSNYVQEYILNSVSKENNIFMVGDVKQSIYKFRQACPELFLYKYATYTSDKEDGGKKIQLFKNFRSRENVLSITNQIFQDIMSKKMGDIEYTKEEYLNLGEPYAEPEQDINYAGKTELHIIDLKENEDKEQVDEEEPIENTELEAKFVAEKIKELTNENYYVCDKKKNYRKINYKDIVILLRSTKIVAPIYEKALTDLNIPVFSDTSSEYLETIEVNTIISLLKILDNPYNDIPLVTVMRSPIGNFTDNELIEIRLEDRINSFYDSVLKKQLRESDIKEKIDVFLNNLNKWREQSNYVPLDELLWQIYIDTGYYHYVSLMPNGELRQANLKMLFQRAKEYESASFKGLFNFIRFLDNLKKSNGDLGSAKLIGENANVVRIMSIHKSKGLEFPVVFLSGTGKQFNLQDLNEPVLLHQELGFGPKYINYERRIEYSTLAKEAIKIKTKNEVMAEEMRVLYVALTRAKEKIIITGVQKDYEAAMKEKEELLDNDINAEKINPTIVKKYKTYLDWIELVQLKHKEIIQELIQAKVHKKEKILEKEAKIEPIPKKISKIKKEKEIYQKIDESLTWKYPYETDTKLEGKTSVGRLKEEEKSTKTIKKPQFLSDTEKLTSAEKGTLMHLCIQKLDFRKAYTEKSLEELIQKIVANKIILPNQVKAIDKKKILKFMQSDLIKRASKAKEIYKEQPFYLNLKAKEIYGENSNEKILVQGIIDLYFVDENNKIVLVDYKTDYIEKEETLIEKYSKQLELYKTAIEKAWKRKVDETYIYSIYLDKIIEIV